MNRPAKNLHVIPKLLLLLILSVALVAGANLLTTPSTDVAQAQQLLTNEFRCEVKPSSSQSNCRYIINGSINSRIIGLTDKWIKQKVDEAIKTSCRRWRCPPSGNIIVNLKVRDSAGAGGFTTHIPGSGIFDIEISGKNLADIETSIKHEIDHLSRQSGICLMLFSCEEGLALLAENKNEIQKFWKLFENKFIQYQQQNQGDALFQSEKLLREGNYYATDQLLQYAAAQSLFTFLLLEKGGREPIIQFLHETKQIGFKNAFQQAYGSFRDVDIGWYRWYMGIWGQQGISPSQKTLDELFERVQQKLGDTCSPSISEPFFEVSPPLQPQSETEEQIKQRLKEELEELRNILNKSYAK